MSFERVATELKYGRFSRKTRTLRSQLSVGSVNSNRADFETESKRNYDGNKSTFGNVSVVTTVPNPDQVSAFSAIRTADNSLTIMVVNKRGYCQMLLTAS